MILEEAPTGPEFDAGDEDDVRASAERARLAAETREADLRWLMADPRGRRIVWRLLDRAGVFRISFAVDPAQTAFNEGGRNTGLALLDELLTLDAGAFAAMLTESRGDD